MSEAEIRARDAEWVGPRDQWNIYELLEDRRECLAIIRQRDQTIQRLEEALRLADGCALAGWRFARGGSEFVRQDVLNAHNAYQDYRRAALSQAKGNAT